MRLKKVLLPLAVMAGIAVLVSLLPKAAHADNPVISTICSNVDCLNNFTVKTGYSIKKDQFGTGGFTDLKKDWYLSPAPGFNYLGNGFTQTPAFDANVVFKGGKLLSDTVPYIHDFVNSHPFTQGLMKYTVVGFSWSNSFSGTGWYDMEWIGANVKFD